MKKKLLAMALVVVMSLAILPLSAGAAFSARSTDPGLNNTAYTSGNPYPKKQCTWYAWGRYKELCGASLPAWGNAENWYAKAKSAGYSVGDEPKLGAIACWDSWNHVAIVEKIDGGNIYVSQYNRQGKEKFGGLDKNSNGSEKKDASGNNIWTTWEMMGVNGSREGKAGGTPSHYIYLKENTTPPKTFTVTFDPNGGNMASTKKTFTVGTHERLGTLPTPTRTGYEFLSWTISDIPPADGVPGEVSSSLFVSSDSLAQYDDQGSSYTVYARWFPNRYTASLDAAGGTAAKTSIDIYYDCSYGVMDRLPTPIRDGYTFDGWYTSASGGSRVTNDTKVTTMGNQTLYAHWTQVTVKPDCSNGHTYGSWQIIKEASCGAAGQRQRSCSVCNKVETETIPALEHNYKLTGSTARQETYTCTHCVDTYTVDTHSNCERDGHRFGGWEIVQNATCGAPGQRKRICEVCHQRENEPIAATGSHNYNAKTGTCYDCGAIRASSLPFSSINSYYDGLFTDVGYGDWFYLNVATAYELGLMKGTGSETFSPGNNMTLAEAVTLAARIHKRYNTGSEDFPSYDGGNWYDPYVDYAMENNIINTYYDYARPATREQFVYILAKALPKSELADITGGVAFADSTDITYAADVELLSRAGVINGINESGQVYFKPWNAITRAEVAAVVGRMAQPDTRIAK